MRTCLKCGQEKPLEMFKRHKRYRDGRHTTCKACHAAAERARRRANPERERQRTRAWRAANREKLSAQRAARNRQNPEPNRRRARAWRAENLERSLERAREWQKQNPERKRELAQAWRDRNRESLRAKARAHNHARRAAPYNSDDLDYVDVLLRDPCAYCGAEPAAPQIDHIVPISAGGPNHWENLTAACGSCNASKCDAPLLTFLARRQVSE